MAVEWWTIEGFPNYEANAYGYVRNATTRRRLRLYDAGDMLRVTLYADGVPHGMNVGAAVLMAFVGPRPSPAYDCSHLDGDYKNNRRSNLAWETRRRNIARRGEHGRTRMGEKHGRARLTEAQAREVLDLRAQGMTYAAIARRFNVCDATVSHIANGRNWKHLQ